MFDRNADCLVAVFAIRPFARLGRCGKQAVALWTIRVAIHVRNQNDHRPTEFVARESQRTNEWDRILVDPIAEDRKAAEPSDRTSPSLTKFRKSLWIEIR